MRVTNWNAFDALCTRLVQENPNQAAFTVKLKPNSKLLVLRLSTKTGSATFQSRSSVFLNRFYNLQTKLNTQLANVRPPKPTLSSTPSGAEEAAAGAEPSTAAGQGEAVEGGEGKTGEPKSKKKKPKKKK